MQILKRYSVCALHLNNNSVTIETIQVRISASSPKAAKEGDVKYWKSKGIEPIFLNNPFDVIEER